MVISLEGRISQRSNLGQNQRSSNNLSYVLIFALKVATHTVIPIDIVERIKEEKFTPSISSAWHAVFDCWGVITSSCCMIHLLWIVCSNVGLMTVLNCWFPSSTHLLIISLLLGIRGVYCDRCLFGAVVDAAIVYSSKRTGFPVLRAAECSRRKHSSVTIAMSF